MMRLCRPTDIILGWVAPSFVEDVEGVLDQAEPPIGMAHGVGVLAVVGGERAGHDQVRLALDGLPERQLVAVVVAVAGEAAMPDHQAARRGNEKSPLKPQANRRQ
jgi:hypothetical protein